uniref:t-SNARE coiled-coil homology domain-containing protein n=1 Tax=Gasterosteus aculeatus aculeatus TaxID=481459 RepID=G3N4N2_GASAC
MSTEDPFFVVKGEVQKALSRARALFDRWEELLQDGTQVSRDELDWSANELRNCLRAIDWDLEDLSETISIVESNPGKFRLADSELQERRGFVERTRTSVQEMKDQLSSPSAVAQAEKKNREALLTSSGQDRSTGLEAHLVSANSKYLQEQQEQQQLIVQEQDEQLELVSGSIRVLKDMSGRIGDELDEQAVMLGDFGDEMDQTSSRMDSVLKKHVCAERATTSSLTVVFFCIYDLRRAAGAQRVASSLRRVGFFLLELQDGWKSDSRGFSNFWTNLVNTCFRVIGYRPPRR